MRRTMTFDGVEYAPGKRFRVVKEGAGLTGWKPTRPYVHDGWGKMLHIGEVIECNGFGPGWGSDPGYGIEWRIEGVNSVMFRPDHGGPFAYRPVPGYLEEVSDE